MRRMVVAGFLVVLSVSGCSAMKASDAGSEPASRTGAVAPASAPQSPPESPPPPAAPPSAPPAAIATPAVTAPNTPAVGTAPSSSPAKTKPTLVARPPAPAGTAPAAVVQSKPQASAAPAAVPATSPSPQSLPSLNLHDLEQRLRDTRAIGVFAKLSLKNQVDDLLSAFREMYRVPNRRPPADLRQRYDLLMLKVLSLLQDSDPPLASAIASSREAIWSILADPDKFSKI